MLRPLRNHSLFLHAGRITERMRLTVCSENKGKMEDGEAESSTAEAREREEMSGCKGEQLEGK